MSQRTLVYFPTNTWLSILIYSHALSSEAFAACSILDCITHRPLWYSGYGQLSPEKQYSHVLSHRRIWSLPQPIAQILLPTTPIQDTPQTTLAMRPL